MRSLAKGVGIVAAAFVCAAVFGAGVPIFWVWVASQVQPTTGPGVSEFAAAIVIGGPLVSFFVLVAVVNRFTAGERPGQRMAWMRSRDEVRESAQTTTSFEQVLILATFLVLVAFNVWYFFFAQCPSTQCFGN